MAANPEGPLADEANLKACKAVLACRTYHLWSEATEGETPHPLVDERQGHCRWTWWTVSI
jgi:hypothetical protein